jgi:hypothetical protein
MKKRKKRGEPCRECEGKLLGRVAEGRSRGESSSFSVGAGREPTGLSGGRESRGNDTAGLTEGKEMIPRVGTNDAATVGCEGESLKVEWSEQVTGGVGEREGSRPSNKFGGIGSSSWGKQLYSAKFHNVVERVNREAIPLGPPAAPRVTQGFVRRVLKEELNMIYAGSDRVGAVGVGSG